MHYLFITLFFFLFSGIWLLLKHAYRYLHFKVILVHLDPNVSHSPVEEPGWPEHQHQLQVSWKCPLNHTTLTRGAVTVLLNNNFYFKNTNITTLTHF